MAALCAAISPVVLLLQPEDARALAPLLAFGFGMMLVLGLLVRFTRLSLPFFSAALVVVTLAMFTLSVGLLGNQVNPPFVFVVFLPLLAVAVGAPDDRLSIGFAIGGSAVAQVWLYATMGLDGREVFEWTLAGLTASCVAILATRQNRRLINAHRSADEARIETLERLRQSETRRERAERMAVVGQLAAGVAHEINNPLAFTTSNLRYLQTELAGHSADTDEVIGETLIGLSRIAQIVRDLGAFSRGMDEDNEVADVARGIEEALRMGALKLKRASGVEVSVPQGLPKVRFSDRKLVQVMLNLLVNASDAVAQSGRPGRVRVRAEAMPEDGDERGVRVIVEDDGPGIPADVLPRIFDPFFTTKPVGQGTGLGLSLSHEYSRQHGGRLSAENRDEGGARLVLELLPAATDAATNGAPDAATETAPDAGEQAPRA